jgi:uncharacterized protein (DUF302 family)
VYYERVSKLSPQEVLSLAEDVLDHHGFRLAAVRDIGEEFLKLGTPIKGGLCVIEVTGAQHATEILPAYPQAALVAPYRILIYSRDGRTRVGMLLPTALQKMLPDPEIGLVEKRRLGQLAREYEKLFKRLIRDLCAAEP